MGVGTFWVSVGGWGYFLSVVGVSGGIFCISGSGYTFFISAKSGVGVSGHFS